MRRKRKERAKDRQARVILELARRNGGAVKLAEVSEAINTGKSYAHRLLRWLVDEGYMLRRGYGVYQMRKEYGE
jgi:DNA-binding IclR family transcriptional regulator